MSLQRRLGVAGLRACPRRTPSGATANVRYRTIARRAVTVRGGRRAFALDRLANLDRLASGTYRVTLTTSVDGGVTSRVGQSLLVVG